MNVMSLRITKYSELNYYREFYCYIIGQRPTPLLFLLFAYSRESLYYLSLRSSRTQNVFFSSVFFFFFGFLMLETTHLLYNSLLVVPVYISNSSY